jgi:hypothetical protein
MERDQQKKIEQIKSLGPDDPNISSQRGPCRFEPGEDGALRRAKEEKVAESLRRAQPPPPPQPPRPPRRDSNIDGFVPADAVDHDGEYIATRREGGVQLHYIAWRDHGQWRRMSDWSEQMPESLSLHAEILFAPEPGRLLMRPEAGPIV